MYRSYKIRIESIAGNGGILGGIVYIEIVISVDGVVLYTVLGIFIVFGEFFRIGYIV